MTQWLLDFFNDLKKKMFYGRIILAFEAGKVVNIKKEENIKPGE
jgi:hypothetical protein